MMDFSMQTTADENEMAAAYEVPYRKAGSPLYIELHKHLFPPESDAYGDLNRFFEGIFDRAVAEDIQGNTVYTMDHTDHLFYLICHSFKHYLHSGFGIRQVCDIIMYANEYGTRIDWMRVLQNCGRSMRINLRPRPSKLEVNTWSLIRIRLLTRMPGGRSGSMRSRCWFPEVCTVVPI